MPSHIDVDGVGVNGETGISIEFLMNAAPCRWSFIICGRLRCCVISRTVDRHTRRHRHPVIRPAAITASLQARFHDSSVSFPAEQRLRSRTSRFLSLIPAVLCRVHEQGVWINRGPSGRRVGAPWCIVNTVGLLSSSSTALEGLNSPIQA